MAAIFQEVFGDSLVTAPTDKHEIVRDDFIRNSDICLYQIALTYKTKHITIQDKWIV